MTKITMYNAYFGDCFRINNQLVVDFGIHRNSKIPNGLKRADICDAILEDLAKIDGLEMLVTHFHEDHIYGLIHMLKSGKIRIPFRTFYIPDIFSGKVSTSVLPLMLLEELLEGYYVGGSNCNLCQFCQAVCGSVANVRLLKRGDIFRQYTVLWPDVDFLQKQYSRFAREFLLEQKVYYKELVRIAKEISSIMRSVSGGDGAENSNVRGGYQVRLRELESEMKELQQTIDFTEEEHKQFQVNSFGNWISIVFHNTKSGEENLLFTGDVEQDHMSEIEKMGDISLHERYKYIKIPHHGTKSHYWDFYKYHPDIFLIPIGECRKGWVISEQYADNGLSHEPLRCCSNCNACKAWDAVSKCRCKNRIIVYRSSGSQISIKI